MAWSGLGWDHRWCSEIDRFPSAVLAHHWPNVPNLGDMTTAVDHERFETVDLLVGGTPCQSFSIAGKRLGLDDPRGGLALAYLKLARDCGARWIVWENVPGVLSSDGGRDFGAFLGALGELGYGWAYRILDAQYVRTHQHPRAVPQRRRRVFVVGYLGDWRRAAAVLFEPASLRGHSAPRRGSREGVAGTLAPGAHPGGFNGQDAYNGQLIAARESGPGWWMEDDKAGPLRAEGESRPSRPSHIIAHTLRGEGFDASEGGTGRGTPLYYSHDYNQDRIYGTDGPAPAVTANDSNRARNVMVPAAFAQNTRSEVRYLGGDGSLAGALAAEPGTNQQTYIAGAGAVRRLTPRECERLQGFPDDHTLVPHRNKPARDGPRYKAIGNSMAVPVLAWIGDRIARYETTD